MKNKTLRDIIDENPSRAMVLENNGIAFMQHMDKTLKQVCEDNKIDAEKLQNELKLLGQQQFAINFNHVSVNFLIEYLINTHHDYAKAKLPAIRKLITQLARTDESYRRLEKCYRKFSNQMRKHIILEEEVVFPFILRLHGLYEDFNKDEAQQLLSRYSTEVLCHNHEHDEDEMEELRQLTRNFTSTPAQQLGYRIVMHELKCLAKDMQQHAAIEDHVLFKKAGQIEDVICKRLRNGG